MTLSRTRRTAIVAACAAVITVAAALPAHAAKDPKKWGSTFCGAVTDWADTIQEGAAALQAQTNTTVPISPTQGKQLLVDYLGETADTTAEFGDTVRGAGDPAVKNGKAIQSTILEGIAGVEALLTSLTTQAGQLPTTDAATFRTAAAPIETQLDTVAVPFQDAMDEVASLEKKNELSKAIKKVKACKALFG